MATREFMLYVPESVAAEPANGRCIVDHWWLVHPTLGVAFYEYGDPDRIAPQCNVNRRIVELDRLHKTGGHAVKRIPVVYVAHAFRERRRLREVSP